MKKIVKEQLIKMFNCNWMITFEIQSDRELKKEQEDFINYLQNNKK